MNDPIRSFGGVATGLARNPLGIIALFIVLVYGFASLVTAFGGSLSPQERLPLIYFMVVFPILVLAVFGWLVSRHSTELFAPSDYKDEANYVAMQKLKREQLRQLSQDLSAEAASMVDAAIEHPGSISEDQIRSASKIEIQAKALETDVIRTQLSQLCAEYENLRKGMPPGQARTRAMTQVLVKMRTLGRAAEHLLDELKQSAAAGDRLAAVAIMQIDPGKADIEWLVARFGSEKPFVFYQSAIALLNVARSDDRERAAAAVEAARRAKNTIEAFDGPTDRNTIQVLDMILNRG